MNEIYDELVQEEAGPDAFEPNHCTAGKLIDWPSERGRYAYGTGDQSSEQQDKPYELQLDGSARQSSMRYDEEKSQGVNEAAQMSSDKAVLEPSNANANALSSPTSE